MLLKVYIVVLKVYTIVLFINMVMKIKLIIVDSFDAAYPAAPAHYFFTGSHMDRWVYSPDVCPKVIETDFRQMACV